jgi:two-component system, cell cycle response regulator
MPTITLLGISQPEAQLIQRVLALVQPRGLRYTLTDTAPAAGTHGIVIVNADDPSSVRAWRSIRKTRQELAGIAVSARPAVRICESDIELRRPFRATELMRALEEVDTARLAPAPKARPAAPAPATIRPAIQQYHRPPHFSGRALVIDDSKTIRRQLQLVLSDYGLEVEVAESGELALHMLATRDFNIVLLDVVLPGADGYQICKTIKRNRSRKPPPVVMLTSKSSPFDRVRGSLAGCDGYITKPAQLVRIKEAIARHLTPASDAVSTQVMP